MLTCTPSVGRLVGALDNDRDAWGGFSNSTAKDDTVLRVQHSWFEDIVVKCPSVGVQVLQRKRTCKPLFEL